MGVARHKLPPELVGVPIEEIMRRYVGRFRDRKADWAAFEDAKIEGFRRAQHRFIGARGSRKPAAPPPFPPGPSSPPPPSSRPGHGHPPPPPPDAQGLFVPSRC